MMKSILIKLILFVSMVILGQTFAFGQNTSSSKRQENKRLKMMKSLSKKTCDQFSSMGITKLNEKLISELYIKLLTDNHKKINKYYETLSEDGLRTFVSDLRDELIIDCKLVQDYIKEKE